MSIVNRDYKVSAPDGKEFTVNGPLNASDEEVIAQVQKQNTNYWNKQALLVPANNLEDIINYRVAKTQGDTNLEAFNKSGIIQGVDDTGKPIEGRYMTEIDDSEAAFIDGVWTMSDDSSEKYKFSLDKLTTDDFNKTIPVEAQTKSKIEYSSFLDKMHKYPYLEKLKLKSTLGQAIKHDKLYERHPFLKKINLELENTGEDDTFGEYSPIDNTISLNPNAFKGYSVERVLKTLLHEIQHNIDNFADPRHKDGPRAGRSFRLKETTARTSANRMNMNEEERKQNPPFLVTKEDGTQDIDIIESKRILDKTELSPTYYHKDTDPLIIDVYDDLLKHEGESGDTTGAAKTLKRGLTVETKKFIEKWASDFIGKEITYTDEQASKEYINYLNIQLEKLENYDTLPYEAKRELLNNFYNIGHTAITDNKQYSKLKQAIKNSKEGKDLDKVFYQLLDTATAEGKSSRGIANRRAESYNKFATEKITHINQLKDGTLQYLSNDKIIFQYRPRKGRHPDSRVGKFKVESSQP